MRKEYYFLVPSATVILLMVMQSMPKSDLRYSNDSIDRDRPQLLFQKIESWITDHDIPCASSLHVGGKFSHISFLHQNKFTHYINPSFRQLSTTNLTVQEHMTHCPCQKQEKRLTGLRLELLYPSRPKMRYTEIEVSFISDRKKVTKVVIAREALCIQQFLDVYENGFTCPKIEL